MLLPFFSPQNTFRVESLRLMIDLNYNYHIGFGIKLVDDETLKVQVVRYWCMLSCARLSKTLAIL